MDSNSKSLAETMASVEASQNTQAAVPKKLSARQKKNRKRDTRTDAERKHDEDLLNAKMFEDPRTPAQIEEDRKVQKKKLKQD